MKCQGKMNALSCHDQAQTSSANTSNRVHGREALENLTKSELQKLPALWLMADSMREASTATEYGKEFIKQIQAQQEYIQNISLYGTCILSKLATDETTISKDNQSIKSKCAVLMDSLNLEGQKKVASELMLDVITKESQIKNTALQQKNDDQEQKLKSHIETLRNNLTTISDGLNIAVDFIGWFNTEARMGYQSRGRLAQRGSLAQRGVNSASESLKEALSQIQLVSNLIHGD